MDRTSTRLSWLPAARRLLRPTAAGIAAVALLCTAPREAPAARTSSFDPAKAAFAVRFGETITSFRVVGVYALPGEVIEIAAGGGVGSGGYFAAAYTRAGFSLQSPSGEVIEEGVNKWKWKAPEGPGLYPLTVRRSVESLRSRPRPHASRGPREATAAGSSPGLVPPAMRPTGPGGSSGFRQLNARGQASLAGAGPAFSVPSLGAPADAPEPSTDAITLNVFVMVPYEKMRGESLRGYRIGRYPSSPPENLPHCKRPRGFVEVTRENEDALVSPHFRVKQFLCKEEGGYPKYVVLRERFLSKLECALERTNAAGYRCDTFHVMSGYRTPQYNRALGNVKYSQHLWGAAADVFVDESPKDGVMDDLNRDGVIDIRDAAVLYNIIDEMCSDPSNKSLAGGLARYEATPSHGPFVHLDSRGHRARWGN